MALSYKLHSGTGAQTSFAIEIDYLSESHVQVYVSDVLKSSPTQYTISGTNVVFTAGNIPVSGTNNVKIQRVTPKDFPSRQVDYVDQATIQEDTLELDQKQIFFMVQEANESDDAGAVHPGAEYIRYDSTAGKWDAQRASADVKIGGVKDPENDQDVSTKKYVDDIAAWGNSAVPQSWRFAGTGSVTYTLTGADAAETNMMLVFLNGDTIYAPGIDYEVIPTTGGALLNFIAGTEPQVTDTLDVMNLGRQRYVNIPTVPANSVDTDAIVNQAVTTEKLALLGVSKDQMGPDSVDTTELVDASVTEPKLAAGAIDYTKLVAATPFTVITADPSYDKLVVVKRSDNKQELRTLATTDLNDWDTRIAAISLSDLSAPTADLAMGSNRLIGIVETPTSNTEAASKGYVDTVHAGGSTSKIDLVYDLVNSSNTTTWLWGNSWVAGSYLYYTITITLVQWGTATKLQITTGAGGSATTITGWPSYNVSQPGLVSFMLSEATSATVPPQALMTGLGGQAIVGSSIGALTTIGLTGNTGAILSGCRVMIHGYKAS